MTCMVLCFLVFPTNNIMRPHDRLAIPTFHIDAPRWVVRLLPSGKEASFITMC
jgi:hypothetical protein